MSSRFGLPFEEPDPEPLEPEPPVAAPRRILTVAELTGRIRVQLEESFADVWVEGELSNCRLWHTGHLYLTLKDGNAQIRGVMFRSDVRALRFKPQDGMRVVARGRISVYDAKGEYQLVCERLEPEGLGALQLAFDQLKQRLAAEGLFDERRKRRLPVLPRKIGVVTSLEGAAVRDIVKVLRNRYW
jgi:exodeoxyribonuclease VII large subunit